MATKDASIPRILWAIDPFGDAADLQLASGWAIKAWLSKVPAQVEPVYIVPDPGSRLPPKLRGELVRNATADAQDEIEIWAHRLKLKNLLPVRALGPAPSSKRAQAGLLLSYAKKSGAILIIISTRAQRGPARWFLGSFAETLSLISEVPLLIVSPSWDRRMGFDHILFPTDFSEDSRLALQEVIPIARALGSQLIVFHKFGFPEKGAVEFTLGGNAVKLRAWELAESQRLAKHWAQQAQASGIRADFRIDVSRSDSVPVAILRAAKRFPGLIAMAVESDRHGVHLLGSTIRQIMRRSSQPIWLVHPRPPGRAEKRTQWAA